MWSQSLLLYTLYFLFIINYLLIEIIINKYVLRTLLFFYSFITMYKCVLSSNISKSQYIIQYKSEFTIKSQINIYRNHNEIERGAQLQLVSNDSFIGAVERALLKRNDNFVKRISLSHYKKKGKIIEYQRIRLRYRLCQMCIYKDSRHFARAMKTHPHHRRNQSSHGGGVDHYPQLKKNTGHFIGFFC